MSLAEWIELMINNGKINPDWSETEFVNEAKKWGVCGSIGLGNEIDMNYGPNGRQFYFASYSKDTGERVYTEEFSGKWKDLWQVIRNRNKIEEQITFW